MKKLLSFTLLALLTSAATAFAGTATGTVNVTAQIMPVCYVTSTPDAAFGQITLADSGGVGAVPGTTSDVKIWCTNTTPFTVAALTSTNGGFLITGDGSGGGKKIPYAIFHNVGDTVGMSGSGAGPFTGIGQGASTPATLGVYADVSAIPMGAANAVPGNYTDTVSISVSY